MANAELSMLRTVTEAEIVEAVEAGETPVVAFAEKVRFDVRKDVKGWIPCVYTGGFGYLSPPVPTAAEAVRLAVQEARKIMADHEAA